MTFLYITRTRDKFHRQLDRHYFLSLTLQCFTLLFIELNCHGIELTRRKPNLFASSNIQIQETFERAHQSNLLHSFSLFCFCSVRMKLTREIILENVFYVLPLSLSLSLLFISV